VKLVKTKNPSREKIMELAEKMFYEMEPIDGLTFDNAPYMLVRPIINDAAKKLGWKPENAD
jgi:hypothetical protein